MRVLLIGDMGGDCLRVGLLRLSGPGLLCGYAVAQGGVGTLPRGGLVCYPVPQQGVGLGACRGLCGYPVAEARVRGLPGTGLVGYPGAQGAVGGLPGGRLVCQVLRQLALGLGGACYLLLEEGLGLVVYILGPFGAVPAVEGAVGGAIYDFMVADPRVGGGDRVHLLETVRVMVGGLHLVEAGLVDEGSGVTSRGILPFDFCVFLTHENSSMSCLMISSTNAGSSAKKGRLMKWSRACGCE